MFIESYLDAKYMEKSNEAILKNSITDGWTGGQSEFIESSNRARGQKEQNERIKNASFPGLGQKFHFFLFPVHIRIKFTDTFLRTKIAAASIKSLLM